MTFLEYIASSVPVFNIDYLIMRIPYTVMSIDVEIAATTSILYHYFKYRQ